MQCYSKKGFNTKESTLVLACQLVTVNLTFHITAPHYTPETFLNL